MADFDLDGARKAGYSDDEIASALGEKYGFDTASALQAGYKPQEIIGELTQGGLKRGFKTALGQTVPLMKGAIGLAAKTVGADSVADWGLRGYQEGMQKLQPLSREGDDVSVAWDRAKDGDVGALLDWASYAGGYTAGQLAETVGTAAAGALIGGMVGGPAGGAAGGATGILAKSAAKGFLSDLIEKQVAKRVAAGMTEKAAAKSVARDIGAGAALGVYNLGQEAGTIYGEGASLAGEEGRNLDGGDLARMWGSSIAAAATETGTDILGLKLGTGKIKIPGGTGGRIATGIMGGAAIEGAQEGVQTALERFGAGTGMDTPEAFRDYVNSIALGAFAGGAVGGVGGAFSKPEKPAAKPAADTPPPVQPPAPPAGLIPEVPSSLQMSGPSGGINEGPIPRQQKTQAELDAERLYAERDAVEASIRDVYGAQTVDDAIAAAERLASGDGLPELSGTQERMFGGMAQDAAQASDARRKQFELDQLQESGRDATVEQADALTAAQGFDEPTKTAMQIAIEKARALSASMKEGGAKEVVAPQQAAVSDAAHEAATSPRNSLPEPTEAQKDAGNYKKGHVSINGLNISIENPIGSRRRPEWPEMKSHYGYIRGTEGKDKDHIDVFVPDNTQADYSGPVAVVNQIDPKTGKFDEHKVVLGAKDEADARRIYAENYTKGWSGAGSVAMFADMDAFKAWLRDGNHKQPAPVVTTPDVVAEPAPSVAEPAARSEDTFLEQLFGTPSEQAASQEKFLADQSSQKRSLSIIRGGIESEKQRARKEYDDWSGRVYKSNKTQVELRGDGPSKNPSMSIGAINENRRRNAMESLSQEMSALEKLGNTVSTDSGAERVMQNLRDLMKRAEKAVESGNWPGMNADQMFESMLLEDLKFRGPGGKGNVTSNKLSKAILAFVKSDSVPTEPAAAPVEESKPAVQESQAEPVPAVAQEPQGVENGKEQRKETPEVLKEPAAPTKYQGRADVLKAMAKEAGWAEVGGRIIRDPVSGEVTGRTRWIPKAEWWRGRPDGINEDDFRTAVRKAIAGEKLKIGEVRALDYALEYQRQLEQHQQELAALSEQEREVEQDMEEIGLEAVSREHSSDEWQNMSEDEKESALDDIFGTDTRDEPATESKAEEGQAGAQSAPVETGKSGGQAEDGRAERGQEVGAARTLNEDGRATDGKPINPGDVFRTLSGRNTTPYPKQKGEKYASQWLIDNAVAEASSRGDDFNAPAFKREQIQKSGGLAPASRQSMLMYLFGEQPEVPRPFLKPLAPTLELKAQSESDLRAAEQAQKDAEAKRAAEEKAAEDKRKADAERGGFLLTGSDRAADANQNQGDIFSVNPGVAKGAAKSLDEITVMVPAVSMQTGKIAKVKRNARYALGNVDKQLEKARGLLQCLMS